MEKHLIGLTAIVAVGFLARWLAWRLRLPDILLLLLCGLVAGPLTGWLKPDELFGEALFPIVSISVAIILFEGGLGLRFRELRETAAVRNLVILGTLVTWLLATALGIVTLGMSWRIALLLGAILTVTGPTVIIPLLQYVRPKGQVAAVARWEGILIDPIGALLAVLAYEAIASKVLDGWSPALFWHYSSGILIGLLAGALAAGLIVIALQAFLIPDSLLNPFSLAVVVSTFTGANLIRAETGLVAVTVMGVVLANQHRVSVHKILEFKENLRVLLISSLFIILAARLKVSDIQQLGPGAAVFVAGLILIVRPAAVFLSTLRSGLSKKERQFLAGLAPRGIVAASVSAILAERLAKTGSQEAGLLVPVVFAVVITTVAVYGLGAAPLARRLKIADSNPQGILFIGAHSKLLALGELLRREEIPVVFIDSDWSNVSRARIKGLRAYYGNASSEQATDDIDLQGIGRVLAFTAHNDTNSLAALHFSRLFGQAETYQVRVGPTRISGRKETAKHLSGRLLFGPEINYEALTDRFDRGFTFKTTPLTPRFGGARFTAQYGSEALPFFLLDEKGTLTVLTDGLPDNIPAASRVISLVPPQAEVVGEKDLDLRLADA